MTSTNRSKAAEPTEDGAKKLSFSSSWKIISVGYRSAAEKMLGFKVGDRAYRVNGTWTLDEQYEYWLFDMSTAVESFMALEVMHFAQIYNIALAPLHADSVSHRWTGEWRGESVAFIYDRD